MKISAKFTILGYIGTYYAIGAALPLSVTNYFLVRLISFARLLFISIGTLKIRVVLIIYKQITSVYLSISALRTTPSSRALTAENYF